MSLRPKAELLVLVSLSVLCRVTVAAGGDSISATQAGQQVVVSGPASQAITNAAARVPPDQLPIVPISSLTAQLVQSRTNPLVRVEGVVLDQGLGDYVVIQDETGTIRAETFQTTPLGGGQRVVARGRLYWDGNHVFLRNASVQPQTWDSMVKRKIVPAPGKPDQLPVLTQVREIRALPPEQAAWQYPVRVRGVVTTLWKDYKALFVQDDTAGIFVSAPALALDARIEVGDEVEVEGVSGPGGYAPVIESDAVKGVGRGELPAPRPVTLYQMASGQFDAQWIEVRGVVRSVHTVRRSTNLQLGDVNGLVEVDVPGGEVLTNLVDSLVRVRGVCVSRANPNRQLTTAYVWSPATNLVVVEEPGVADPFTLPAQPIASLSRFNQWRATQHRVRIEGVVTFSEPGRPLFVQDETGGVPVYLARTADFQPGDRVTVAGYLSPTDFGYAFRNASCRLDSHGRIPAPKPLSSLSVLNEELNGLWVEVTARLVSYSRRANEAVMTLQADGSIFEAIRPGNTIGEDLVPRAGSLLRLRGVYSLLGDETRQPRALRLYIPGGDSIQVVEKPSWWNARRASTGVAVLVAIILAAVLWAITLRRRVSEQTLVLRERLERESALQQSYREIFEGASDLIFTCDLDGRLTSINSAGQRVLGYSADEVSRLTLQQIFAPDSDGSAKLLGEAKSAEGGVATRECEFIARDGRRILAEASLRRMLKDGRPCGVQAIARDITERKRAEEALRDSEARYRRLVELSPTAIYIQCEGKVAFINEAALRLFCAATPADMLGRPVLELVHPDFREAVSRRMASLRDTGNSVPLLDEKYLRLDGSVVDVEVAAAPFMLGNRPAVQVIVYDITDRKTAEAALQQSELKFRSLVEQSLVGVYVIQEGRFAYINPRMAEIFGYGQEEMIRTCTVSDAVFEADRPLVEAQIRRRIDAEESTAHYQFRGRRKDGSLAFVEVLGSRTEYGGKPAVLGTLMDITERKQAEEALAEASSLLETMLENSPDSIYFKDRESRFVRYSKSMLNLFQVSDPESLRGKTDFDFFLEEHARAAFEDEQEIIRTGQPIIGKPEKETHPDGRTTWALTSKLPWRDREGAIIGTFGISKDVTAIKHAEQQLAYERGLFRALVENLPDAIYYKDRESRFVRLSKSKVERARQILIRRFQESQPAGTALPAHLQDVNACASHLIGKTDFDVYPEDRARQAFEQEQAIMRTGQPLIGNVEQTTRLEDGKSVWYLTTKMPWYDERGNVIGTFGVTRDITQLKEAEAQLEAAHQRLIEASRLAGMAEVATDVLHNVGNVLNSVNVSCSLTIDRVRSSRIASLAKVSALIEENRGRLGEFFTHDPRGRQVPDYLSALAEHLSGEQTALLDELEQLIKHIDHIKQIVAMQQNYAKVAGVLEAVNPTQLVDDALHINAAALSRHEVRVQREFQETPFIVTEKHKVLQILVNLIRNAKYALDDAQRPDKRLTLKVDNDDGGGVRIQVIDNGVGIPSENLTRIFSHGFTTRRNGHGFGLHSSALTVRDLGGSLQAHSDGPGRGAVFTLVLPGNPACHAQDPKL